MQTVTGTFTATDGTELAYHARGEGEPLVVLPGGPMRASAYLGDLGGLTAHRRLILLDLRGTGDSAVPADKGTYRCDRLVDDVEVLRAHLGLDHMDLLAHSAGGSLAMLYAARHPERVTRLALITATPWALGMPATPEGRLAAALLRKGEPWFEDAFPAFEAWLAGTADFDPVFEPFFYGRWDAAAEQHAALADEQSNDEAAELYFSEGAFDPPVLMAALGRLPAPVLVLAGELDGGPRPELAGRSADVFLNATSVVQPGAGHYPWLDDPEWFVRHVVAFLDAGGAVLPSAE
ncbi:alpha/beta fold hydrolase [Streptomyces hokutonensis]|uniref:alpha/beta fold hydrolase n=1 Tax=Streptomyces hokutonensis TaxID=1306990 RepID=UPI000377274A|nr:alpha/beta hydrolase [Streptomyces hokutonensis]